MKNFSVFVDQSFANKKAALKIRPKITVKASVIASFCSPWPPHVLVRSWMIHASLLIVKTPKLLARNYIQLGLRKEDSPVVCLFSQAPKTRLKSLWMIHSRAHLVQPFSTTLLRNERKLSPEREKSIKLRSSKAAHDTSLHSFIIVSCNLTLACPILMFYAFSKLAFRHIQLSLPSPINYSVCRPREARGAKEKRQWTGWRGGVGHRVW